MLVSELITKLEELKELAGNDVPVYCWQMDSYGYAELSIPDPTLETPNKLNQVKEFGVYL